MGQIGFGPSSESATADHLFGLSAAPQSHFTLEVRFFLRIFSPHDGQSTEYLSRLFHPA